MATNLFYAPDAVLRHFRRHAAETDARVRAGIEENRKGSATILFEDAEGRPCETTHAALLAGKPVPSPLPLDSYERKGLCGSFPQTCPR